MNHDEYEELMYRASVTATAVSREAQPTCKDCPRPNRDVFRSHKYEVHLCVVCYAKREAAGALRRRLAQEHWAVRA